MSSKLNTPAVFITPVDASCGKVFCKRCKRFLGLVHDDGAGLPKIECQDNASTCAAVRAINEFSPDLQLESEVIPEVDVELELQLSLVDSNPFDYTEE